MTANKYFLLFLLLALAACTPQQPTAVPPTEVAFVTAPVTNTLPSITPSTTPISQSTSQSTRTPLYRIVEGTRAAASAPPTATPVPQTATPFSILTVREPSVDALRAVLDWITGEFTKLIYQDVNGDQEPDLVVDDFLHVAILLWDRDHYQVSFVREALFDHYDPDSRVVLDDWTADGVPEIIFDVRQDTGGTGLLHDYWSKYIIRCEEFTCLEVWGDEVGFITSDGNSGGLNLYRTNIRLEPGPHLKLTVLDRLFSAYSDGFYMPVSLDWDTYKISDLHVYTSTLRTYLWNGAEFALTDTSIVHLPQTIRPEARLGAANEAGVAAVVSAESNFTLGEINDICQLSIGKQPVGDPFGCKENFTTVEWQDVTGDNRSEVVVHTFSAGYPKDQDGNPLGEIECMHQRMIIYSWEAGKADLIANIAGCVVDENMFGVRLEDYDQDGQLEILTPHNLFTGDGCNWREWEQCWYELDPDPGLNIYRWNGYKFILWKEIPDVRRTP